MAKLKKLPSLAIINGFKGTIDYYLWNGIAVARKWPRSPGSNRAPAVQATWPAFSWSASNWKYLSPTIQEAYNQMAVGIPLTGKDLFIKGYIMNEHIEIEVVEG